MIPVPPLPFSNAPPVPPLVLAVEELISRVEAGERAFRGLVLTEITLPRARLFGIDLSGARFTIVDLRAVDLTQANLSAAHLTDACLRGCSMFLTKLRDVRGVRVDLSGANLHAADLSGADLTGCDLRTAQLAHADLRRTVLRGAKLKGANLTRADLTGADLTGADLEDAILLDARMPAGWGEPPPVIAPPDPNAHYEGLFAAFDDEDSEAPSEPEA